MNTAELEAALLTRFAAPEYATFFNVRNGTGFARKRDRYADAIAMSLWPSRGLEVLGFELKASRGDWMRELRNPEKAEEIMKFCDRWYIVAGDRKIVQAGELPPTWGLIVPRGGKLIIEREAPKLEAKPVDRLFLAAMLRAAFTQSPAEKQIEARIAAAVKEQVAREKKWIEYRVEQLTRDIESYKRRIDEFQKASGVYIDAYNGKRIGEAVKIVLNERNKFNNMMRRIEHIGQEARSIAELAEAAVRQVQPEEAEQAP